MDHSIMEDWLCWFDTRVNRQVLLLIDNFPAYKLTVRNLEESNGLRFTTIKWLSPNATSVHQLLNQGIIKNWKAVIRKEFIQFMARTFDLGQNLLSKMNVLRACR